MTDRHAAYIVVLDEDIREDDATPILNALRAIRFVASVEPVTGDYEQVIARTRRDERWQAALTALIRNGPPEGSWR